MLFFFSSTLLHFYFTLSLFVFFASVSSPVPPPAPPFATLNAIHPSIMWSFHSTAYPNPIPPTLPSPQALPLLWYMVPYFVHRHSVVFPRLILFFIYLMGTWGKPHRTATDRRTSFRPLCLVMKGKLVAVGLWSRKRWPFSVKIRRCACLLFPPKCTKEGFWALGEMGQSGSEVLLK